MTDQNKDVLAFIGLSFLTIFIYLFSINAPFYLDDQHMIVDNVFIKNPKYFGWLWNGYVTSSSVPKGMCRPVLMMTFIFNYLFNELSVSGYRIINIMLHLINGALLYSLLKQLKPNISKGFLFIVTAIFLAHPINSESVIYISSRSDLLTATFLLGGVLLWVREKYLASLALYALCLLTKETALCFPMLILAWDILKEKGIKKLINKKYFAPYSIVSLLTLAYFFYRITIFSRTPVTPPRTIMENFFMQSAVTTVYAKIMLFANDLNMMHDVTGFSTILNLYVMVGIALLSAMVYFIIRLFKTSPMAAFGLFWIIAGLSPKFYARLGFPAMEHHAYIPLFGLYIFLAAVIERFYEKQKKYFIYASFTIITLASILTITRGFEYKNPLVFWQISAERAPDTGVVHNYLGLEYLRHGMNQPAKEEFLKAIAIADRKETIVTSKVNIATILKSEGKYKEALQQLREASRVTKIMPIGINHAAGTIYMAMNEPDKAVAMWRRELMLYPDSYETVLNLAIHYFKKGENAAAKELFKRATLLRPEAYIGYYGMAQILEKENDLPTSAQLYQIAIQLNPNDAAAYYYMGSVLSRLGDARAMNYMQTAIALNPRFCEARNDLAVIYASLTTPRWDLAQKEITDAENNGCKINQEFLNLVKQNAAQK